MLVQDRMGRKMAMAIREVHPSACAFYRKRDATVFAENKPLIRPQADTRDEKRFLWDNLQVQKLGWNKQSLLDKFEELDRAAVPASAVKWCV